MNTTTNTNNYDNLFSEYKDVVTIQDITQMLGIGKGTVYNLLRNKKIKSIQLNRKYIIPKKSIIEFLNTAQ